MSDKARIQALFDRVVTHLLQQNVRSEVGNGIGCAYRGNNGLKCAVGCLIEDKNYSHTIEGSSAGNTLVRNVVERSLGYELTREEASLLTQLQVVHDSYDPNAWPEKLREVGTDNKLITGVLLPA